MSWALIPDAVGVVGSLMVIYAYWGITEGRLRADAWPYHALNGGAAVLLLFSLYFRPNPGSILIEILYLGIAAVGLRKTLWRR